MNGAGVLAAADSRTVNSTGPGGLGGLLQASTYVAGLSGGGWLVGSMFTNNFSSVQTLRDGSPGSSVWEFGNSIVQGPAKKGLSLLNTADYFSTIIDQVDSKSDAGFNRSITDYWGRALSYQLVNATDGGPAYTFSSIALDPNFQSGAIPMPILVADSRAPGSTIVSLNSTVYEFNPFELGSWDPTTYGFAPLSYVGSNFSGGVIPDGAECRRGYDQVGYVLGTSSSLFNTFLLNINNTEVPDVLKNVLTGVLEKLGSGNDDIAQWQPNPFYGYNNGTNTNAGYHELTLVDGGEDLQNIPLYPLVQPNRHVDIIFAVDSSMDTPSQWPNGTALVATYERSLNKIQNGTAFPSIPDVNTIVNLGLNSRPTFFGCDAKNITAGDAPLVVYLPNSPYVALSNVSTFDPSYNNTERNAIIQNGYDSFTMGNGSLDASWSACIGCAVLSRSFDRTNTPVPDVCTQCFTKYCWDGRIDSKTPTPYMPSFKLTQLSLLENGASVMGASSVILTLAVLVSVTLL